jgi:transcriptional regulator with XRE-family HTH domain
MSKQGDNEPKVISKLAEYRKKKGLSQDDLAQQTGLTKTTIQNWENGRNLGAVIRVLKVCQRLDVDIRELFDLKEGDDEQKLPGAIADN